MTLAAPIEIRPASAAAFVGREGELRELRERLVAAAGGAPGVVVLEGEAGIGKSRLTREFGAIAREVGFEVCAAGFLASGGMPFGPIVEAITPALERTGIARDAAHAAGIAVVRSLQGNEHAVLRSEGKALYAAVGKLVAELARRRPLLLVFEDVHWAEPDAVDLLLHLAMGIVEPGQRLPVLLLLNTRPAEPASPLASLVARLRREPSAHTLSLHGLDEIEANEFVREAASLPCSPRLLQELLAVTRGNPLFVAEALEALAESGALEPVEGLLSNVSGDAIPLANGLEGVIESRSRSLEPFVATVLSCAALAGDSIDPAALSRIVGADRATILRALDTGVVRGFIHEETPGYRFAHAAIRDAFRQRLAPAERRARHLVIAAEMRAGGAGPIELAHHLVAALPLGDATSAGEAALSAGDSAAGMTAFAEAARYYEAALRIEPFATALAPAECADANLRAAHAHYRNADRAASIERYALAAEAFRAHGNDAGWGRALIGEVRARHTYGALRIGESPDPGAVEAYIAAAGPEALLEKALLMCQWSEILHNARDPGARHWAEDALDIARDLDDDFLSLRANFALGRACQRDLDPQAALDAHRRALAFARKLDEPWWICQGLQNQPQALIALGRLDEAASVAQEALETAREADDWAIQTAAHATMVAIAVLRGEFTIAEHHAREAQRFFRRSGWAYMPAIVFPALAHGRALQGRWQEAFDALDLLEASVPGGSWAQRASIRAATGAIEEVRAEVDGRPGRALWQGPPDMFTLGAISSRIDLAADLGSPNVASFAAGMCQQAHELGNVFGFGPGHLLSRLLGVAAALNGAPSEARARLTTAVRRGEEAGAFPEAALARMSLAALLLEQGEDHEFAAAQLRLALAACEELGMGPAAGRARAIADAHAVAVPAPPVPVAGQLSPFAADVLTAVAEGRDREAIGEAMLVSNTTLGGVLDELRDRLGVTDAATARQLLNPPDVAAGSPVPGGLRILMFCDIVDSTVRNEALGDVAWARLLGRHDAIVSACVNHWRGQVHKKLGDGIFCSFASARDAVACGLEIQSRFPIALEERPDVSVLVRVGLSAGEPVASGEELIGLAVVEARRISDAAEDGSVFVSEAVRLLAGGGSHAFTDRGRFALKGFSEVARLFQVRSRGSAPLPQPVVREDPGAVPIPDGLSSREVEVLRLIAAGKTNGQIAHDLFISPATVARHVSHIFEKTGAANRTEAARYAANRGLV